MRTRLNLEIFIVVVLFVDGLTVCEFSLILIVNTNGTEAHHLTDETLSRTFMVFDTSDTNSVIGSRSQILYKNFIFLLGDFNVH